MSTFWKSPPLDFKVFTRCLSNALNGQNMLRFRLIIVFGVYLAWLLIHPTLALLALFAGNQLVNPR